MGSKQRCVGDLGAGECTFVNDVRTGELIDNKKRYVVEYKKVNAKY